ncbi:MAG TPA: antibiotic biosynthesis monooxygenase [Acidimicrobiales bacterium]|nr:antibiotic biosynthesis monooxygenase [Acidimicrobiales bacterium]
MSGTGSDGDGPAGAVVTVFRSRLRPEAVAEYEETADRMDELVRAMPGFVDYKTFTADDGERVTVVTFGSLEQHRAWRDHPEHREAQRLGRERFYQSYAIQVGTGVRETRFPH